MSGSIEASDLFADDGGSPAGAASSPSSGKPAIGGITLESLAKSALDDAQVAFYRNVFRRMGEHDYQIDHERGLVIFNRPVGHLENEVIPTAEVGKIAAKTPRVRITFAYEDSAAAREAIIALGNDPKKIGASVGEAADQLPSPEGGQGELRYRFHALYDWDRDGRRIVAKTSRLVDSEGAQDLDEFRFPLVVHDEKLHLFVTIRGGSNQAELEAQALEIARAKLDVPQEIAGEDGEAYAFVPIEPSSVIDRVEWEGGDGVCVTRWSVGNVAARKLPLTWGDAVAGWSERVKGKA